MQFNKQWLIEPDSAPNEQRQLAITLANYLTTTDLEADSTQIVTLENSQAVLELVNVLLERKDGVRLAWLQSNKPHKTLRKALGKALHKLRASGVSCDIDNPSVGVVGYSAETLPSYMGTPLATGERMLILSGRPDGYDVSCYAVIHETDGIEDLVSIQDPSRTRLRKIIESITKDNTDDLVVDFAEVDPGLVRTRINAGINIHRELGKSLPQDYSELQSLLADDNYQGPHPAHHLIPLDNENLVSRGAELLGTMGKEHYRQGPADRPVLTQDWLKTFGQRIENAKESTVVIDERQRSERVEAELDRIVSETFDTSLRMNSADRLLDTALILKHAGQTIHAAIAVATANALLDESIKPTEIPWCRQSIHELIGIDFPTVYDHENVQSTNAESDPGEDGGLIIKP